MRLPFGFSLSLERTKAIPSSALNSVHGRGGWFPLVVREPFSGAWQRNIEIKPDTVLAFSAVYSCVTLIANDISKLRVKLVQQDANSIWTETTSPAYSPVLRRPNHYQNRIQFQSAWMTSKLITGNAYILKRRDNRGVVTSLYPLDPHRVRALVAPNGDVYYAVNSDDLSRIEETDMIVPASEIIHDVMTPLFHPLCGVSPVFACGLAALQGLRVQEHSSQFFANGARPGGILTTPGMLSEEQTTDIQRKWEQGYSGTNSGKVAVLHGGFEYKSLVMNAVDAQLIEQLKWTAENVCTAFHVPAYMIGVGATPSYNNVEALNQQYYSQCLQHHIESMELLLDEGLSIAPPMGTELDLDDLLRMDTATRVKAAADGVGSGTVAPNEARQRWLNLPPVTGGGTPYLQQQNFSLSALDARDRSGDPFGQKRQERVDVAPDPNDEMSDEDLERAIPLWQTKTAALGLHYVGH